MVRFAPIFPATPAPVRIRGASSLRASFTSSRDAKPVRCFTPKARSAKALPAPAANFSPALMPPVTSLAPWLIGSLSICCAVEA
jgi:hypothetical protein